MLSQFNSDKKTDVFRNFIGNRNFIYPKYPEEQKYKDRNHKPFLDEKQEVIATNIFLNSTTILLIMVVSAAFVLVLISYLKLVSDDDQLTNIKNNVVSIYENLFSTAPSVKRNIITSTEG